MNMLQINWTNIMPELIVMGSAVIVLLGELFLPARMRRSLGGVALIGLLAALAGVASMWGVQATEFNKMFSVDLTANVLKAILLVTTALVVLGSLKAKVSMGEGEFFSLILFSVLGTMFMASATDLIMLFIALELTVIPAYILTASNRSGRAAEAALKYFLLGLVASVVLLYGMSLLFGLTGE